MVQLRKNLITVSFVQNETKSNSAFVAEQCDQIGRFFALVQLFKAFGNNKFAPIFPILTISTLQCS